MDSKQSIRQFFQDNGNRPATVFDIASAIGFKFDTVNRTAGQMIEAGELKETVKNKVGYLTLDPSFTPTSRSTVVDKNNVPVRDVPEMRQPRFGNRQKRGKE